MTRRSEVERVAREIVDDWKSGGIGWPERLQGRIETALRRARAEAIEECAKVCENTKIVVDREGEMAQETLSDAACRIRALDAPKEETSE